MPWSFLNTSSWRAAGLTFGSFDADPRCDIRAGGILDSGGRYPAL